VLPEGSAELLRRLESMETVELAKNEQDALEVLRAEGEPTRTGLHTYGSDHYGRATIAAGSAERLVAAGVARWARPGWLEPA
jgi:hypothetical protein